MLARVIQSILILCSATFLYLTWESDESYVWFLLGSVAGLVMAYLLAPQINWIWYHFYPPDLHPPLRHMLTTRCLFYQKLPAEEKTRFRQRMAMFMEAQEFMEKGMDSVPMDVKGVIAASAVQVTFGRDEFLMGRFEQVVVYPHPFPSPTYPEKWHASELFEEDGVLLFSAEQLMASFFQPERYFHLGLYEYAKAFRLTKREVVFPEFQWEKLEQASGFSREHLEKWVGLPDLDAAAVAAAHFYVFPRKFKAVMPDEYEKLAEIFRQRPA
ncbi:MAG: zinc-dependent peptidase [Bacteroidota bacterium]